MTSLLWSGLSKTSIPLLGSLPTARRPAPSHCPGHSLDTLVFLLFLQPARSTPSLGPPASDSLPQVTVWPPPSCHSNPVRQPGCHLLCHILPIRTGSPWRQGLVLLLHRLPHVLGTETWAGRPATGDTSREDVSDLDARIPNLASGANGRCSLDKLCMTITWIPTDRRISNF